MTEEQQVPEEILDAEVVEEQPQNTEVVHSTEVAPPVPEAAGVMMPFDADEVKAAMGAYQKTVAATLADSDWQDAGRGQRFVKKSGWRKIAKAFGLSVTRVEDGVERDPDGEPIRAWAVYRAAHPNGQTQDGDGYCSVDESRFNRSGGKQKLENDLRATATTRAKNRAISDLVGMGEVSAEEVAVMGQGAPPAAEAFEGDLRETWDVIENEVGTETTADLRAWIIQDNQGMIPRNVGRTLVAIGRCLKPEEPKVEEDDMDEVPF